MNRVAGPPTFQILERLAEVFKGRLVEAFDFTKCRHNRNRGRDAVNEQTEIKLANLEYFLRPPPLVDIRIYSAPLNDPSRFVGYRAGQAGGPGNLVLRDWDRYRGPCASRVFIRVCVKCRAWHRLLPKYRQYHRPIVLPPHFRCYRFVASDSIG